MHGEKFEGTPQGGPLSPLLAKLQLDDVDRELDRRGHKFVRYADDCNVYLRSRRAGERVLQALRGCDVKLALRVNESKTAVAPVWGSRFLGYCFWAPKNGVKRAVASQALDKLRKRIRQLTRRTRGRSLEQIAADLRRYVPGWKAYFRQVHTPKEQPAVVARQRPGAQPLLADRLLRPTGSPEILLTSTPRTARCGPACRVVWECPGQR